MRETLAALADLTRAHFFFVWPLLFCSGLALAFQNYGGFSWDLVGRAALIGLLGFEAGLVLNDYVDREYDRRDVNGLLTRYWRPFGARPIPAGRISPRAAFAVFLVLTGSAAALAATLPHPTISMSSASWATRTRSSTFTRPRSGTRPCRSPRSSDGRTSPSSP
ncbi:UbiA family prenyltransferase [Methanoculleus sp.]|uniref:UbiA family prenyltransferase n=1 Tax=Methanoculleus sp. TaxID=90427 RepID=UPI0025D71196|nr:UbiA family prenyltransferase [Methanoculleus sp.]